MRVDWEQRSLQLADKKLENVDRPQGALSSMFMCVLEYLDSGLKLRSLKEDST
jgi:hypothetical protein